MHKTGIITNQRYIVVFFSNVCKLSTITLTTEILFGIPKICFPKSLKAVWSTNRLKLNVIS